MTTPLPTGEFQDNSSYAGVFMYFFPFAMVMWSNIGSLLAQISQEKNEDKLTNILKRIGYRPIIEVYRRFYIMIFSWIFMIPLAILIMVLMLPGINVFIGLLIILLIIVEMWLIDILLKYAFGDKWGLAFKLMYYALGFFQSLSLTFNPTMTTGRLITLNLFTMTQFSAFGGIVLQA